MKELSTGTVVGLDLYNGGAGNDLPLNDAITNYVNTEQVIREIYVKIKFVGLVGSGNINITIKVGTSSIVTKPIIGFPTPETTISNTQMQYQSPLIILEHSGGEDTVKVLAVSDNAGDTAISSITTKIIDARANVIQWADSDVTQTNDLPDVNALSTDIDAIKSQTDQLEFDDSDPSGASPIVATLTPTGLDDISIIEPSERASTFREILVKLYYKFFE